MDAGGGHESPYPLPATAWWGVALFSLGAILSYTDRQILTIRVDPIRASLHLTDTQLSLAMSCVIAPSVLIAILLFAVAMLRVGERGAPAASLS